MTKALEKHNILETSLEEVIVYIMNYMPGSYYDINEYKKWLLSQMISARMIGKQNRINDVGPNPLILNLEDAAEMNENFRTIAWTGEHLQLSLMSLKEGEDIGLEMHPDVDQFIRIEYGEGFAVMGDDKDSLNYRENVYGGDAIIVPAGKWHNILNVGSEPLKLYTIYAPPQHPAGTVQRNKEDEK